MRAIVYKKHGGIDRLEEVDLSEPKVRRNRVLVDVHSIGLNPLDYRLRRGEMGPLVTFSKPRLTASDFSGTILDVGSGITDLTPGDRVYGMVNQVFTGTSAERISVSRANLAKSPQNIDDSSNASGCPHRLPSPLRSGQHQRGEAGLGQRRIGRRGNVCNPACKTRRGPRDRRHELSQCELDARYWRP